MSDSFSESVSTSAFNDGKFKQTDLFSVDLCEHMTVSIDSASLEMSKYCRSSRGCGLLLELPKVE